MPDTYFLNNNNRKTNSKLRILLNYSSLSKRYPVRNPEKDPTRLSQIILGHVILSQEKFWKRFSFYDLTESYTTIPSKSEVIIYL